MLLLIATAQAGGLLGDDAAVSAAICAETNRVRALHGLPTVSYTHLRAHET